MRWGDLVISAILLGLCGLAVAKHFGHGEEVRRVIPPVEVGEPLDGNLTLTDIGGVDRVLADFFGRRATVLYSWKVSCPCVDVCEPRLKAIYARYGREQGVAWIAVDGEPED